MTGQRTSPTTITTTATTTNPTSTPTASTRHTRNVIAASVKLGVGRGPINRRAHRKLGKNNGGGEAEQLIKSNVSAVFPIPSGPQGVSWHHPFERTPSQPFPAHKTTRVRTKTPRLAPLTLLFSMMKMQGRSQSLAMLKASKT